MRYLPRWLPGAGFLKQAEIWNKETKDMYVIPYEMTKRKMVSGSAFTYCLLHVDVHQDTGGALDSFVAKTLAAAGDAITPEIEHVIQYGIGSLYSGKFKQLLLHFVLKHSCSRSRHSEAASNVQITASHILTNVRPSPLRCHSSLQWCFTLTSRGRHN